jgi:hypothetical protein
VSRLLKEVKYHIFSRDSSLDVTLIPPTTEVYLDESIANSEVSSTICRENHCWLQGETVHPILMHPDVATFILEHHLFEEKLS